MAQTKVKTKGITDTNVTNAKLGTDISAAKLTAGTVATARLGSGTASSSTILYGDQTYKTEPATYNDDALQNDIATLALHQATNANAAKYNLTNTNVDVFQDSTGVASFTDCERNTTGEYVSSVGSSLLSSNFDFTAGTDTNFLYATESDIAVDNLATYTQEAWVYPTDLSTGNYFGVWGSRDQDQYGTALQLEHGATGNVYWWAGNSSGGTWVGGGGSTATSLPPVDTWAHFAEVQQSGTIKLYMNGTQIHSLTTTGGIMFGNKVGIGMGALTDRKFKGYINEWRYSNNARYTTTFTPSTDAFVSDANTILLVRSNTTDGSTTFTDIGPNTETITRYAGGVVDNSTNIASNISLTTANATGNFVSTATTANASVSKVGIVITYKNNAGTNTLNTDIVAQVSADGGSNYSTVTLAAAGTFSTGVLQAVANDVSVTAGTSIQYKISFANQASGSKEARITGVSLIY